MASLENACDWCRDVRQHTWRIAAVMLIYVLEVSWASSDTATTNTAFGDGGRSVSPIAESIGFPFTKDFFTDHVLSQNPLVMKGAVTDSDPVKLWTDEFFLSMNTIPDDDVVTVETLKKEERNRPATDMHFKDFIEDYNDSQLYMVNPVPDYLGEYVMLPAPLQCEQIYRDLLVENIMWISSGGTKSVVHTDSVDNILCLYSGVKHVVILDPSKLPKLEVIDHPEGAFSSIDVDNIDFAKFPSLRTADYYKTTLHPGDCIFIPFKWIHQVNSVGRNIGINVWFDHHRSSDVDLNTCPDHRGDPELTLDKLDLTSFQHFQNTPGHIRDKFIEYAERTVLDLDTLVDFLLAHSDADFNRPDVGIGFQIPIRQIMRDIDANRDGVLHVNEVYSVDDREWEDIRLHMMHLGAIVHAIEEKQEKEHQQHDEL